MINRSSLTLAVLVVAVATSGCVRRTKSTAVSGTGDRAAFVIECQDMVSCAEKARKSCPGGYDVITSGNVERVDPGIAFAEALDTSENRRLSEAKYSNQQMMIECKDSGPGSTVSDRPAPTGAAGFVFDSTLEDARSTCEKAGYSWSQLGDWYRCDGFPTETPLDGYAKLRFCEDRLCGLQLMQRPGEADDMSWMSRVGKLRELLEERYGPYAKDQSLLFACQRGGSACHQRPNLSATYRWTWAEKYAVELTVRTDPPRGPLTVLSYSSPPLVKQQQAQSL